jgi:hypothetical protein
MGRPPGTLQRLVDTCLPAQGSPGVALKRSSTLAESRKVVSFAGVLQCNRSVYETQQKCYSFFRE